MLRTSRLLLKGSSTRCYSFSARFAAIRTVPYDGRRQSIQNFDTTQPALFKDSFADLPAIAKWFTYDAHSCATLTPYLSHHGDSIVPLELTRSPSPDSPQTSTFERFDAPLALLLSHITGSETPATCLYLAQHSLSDLPPPLQNDLPTPPLLAQLGRGDIYASSLWMGRPPTRTPLHRDPNPNLFVQLAGRKVVRLIRPEVGRGVYERVRSEIGNGGGRASMRGSEMMEGDEMAGLEQAVWGDSGEGEGVEAELESGDGLYIPLGWWHAVHGIGEGANASANWWFR
ncbi:hypothetical protein J1614_009169 [Plenodomus biglobosus]|nr:hypothetical protein J1614_009169 [Plenodomus biglobosus]